MNWIISKSNKMKFHTHLNEVLKPIIDDVSELNWLISDLEYYPDYTKNVPVNHDQDYFILSPIEFKALVDAHAQIIWAVVLGIPQDKSIIMDEDNLPYAEGNEIIWKNGNIQHPNAILEIVCFDSGYTIVKFTDEELSDKFKNHFDEAVELEKF